MIKPLNMDKTKEIVMIFCRLVPSLLIILLITSGSVLAQEDFPSQKEITRIEERGKQIADYERAAIRATDMLLASNPDESKLGLYIAVTKDNIWTIFFGKIIDGKFHLSYYYSCPQGQVNKMKPGGNFKDMSKDSFYFALAVDLALRAIEPDMKSPRYNPSVFREQDGTISVYLMPGTTEPDTVLIGGDFKVSISSDASKVLSKTKLHENTLKAPLKIEGRVGSFHTHVLADLPTETEVALIILNPVLAPHYIIGKTWMSKIDSDGKITVLGKSKEILKGEKNKKNP